MIRILSILFMALFALTSCHHKEDKIEAFAYQSAVNGKWGFIAPDGTVKIAAGSFEQCPTAVVGGMFSLPDKEGYNRLYSMSQPEQPVSLRRFFRIGHFFDEVAPAQETPQSPIYLINKQGKVVFSTNQYSQYDIVLMHNFKESRALIATREGKYGYIDTKGNIVIPPLYDRAYDFNDGLALVGITNQQGETGYQLVDSKGNVRCAILLNNCQLDTHISENRLAYKELSTGQCCYMDETGMPFIRMPKEVREVYAFEHGTAVFQTAIGTGIMDHNGHILIPDNYENIFQISDDRIAVNKQGLWGIADKRGALLGRLQYDSIGYYHDGHHAVARLQGRYMFIDNEGMPTDTYTYTYIAMDLEACRVMPQVFIRQDYREQNSQDEKTLEEKEPVTRQQSENARIKNPPRSTTMSSNDWRSIGRQNPFYEEAAKVISGKLQEADAARRRMILNYVEHLRTSYTTKDIDFLEQLFSENALIVVGTVIRTGTEETNHYLSPSQIIYNVKSKRQYLDRLKQVFKANKSIQVRFSDFHIMRHPTQEGIYGVSLRQGYSSDMYSDDGYLFLLWDFRDETAPKIHVRTWQPALLDDNTPLPADEVFNIRNFNLQ